MKSKRKPIEVLSDSPAGVLYRGRKPSPADIPALLELLNDLGHVAVACRERGEPLTVAGDLGRAQAALTVAEHLRAKQKEHK